VRKVVQSGARDTWLRYFDQIFAKVFKKMKETSKNVNKEVTQFVFIWDFADFSMRQLSSLSSTHYEYVYKSYIPMFIPIYLMSSSIEV